jgi:hypothetical protein
VRRWQTPHLTVLARNANRTAPHRSATALDVFHPKLEETQLPDHGRLTSPRDTRMHARAVRDEQSCTRGSTIPAYMDLGD